MNRINRLAAFAVVSIAVGAWAPGAARAQPGTDACEQAGAGTGQLQSVTRQLCQGAIGTGPVDCFNLAASLGIGGQNDLVSLCRCSVDAEPAECVAANVRAGIGRHDAYRFCLNQKAQSFVSQDCLKKNGNSVG